VGSDYERIGIGYSQIRRPDPRLARLIAEAIGDADRVVNIGAGPGSYEPPDRSVVAVEPSSVMLEQHPDANRVRARAESLPFADASFDAAMAVMTVHHWEDLDRGLREMCRVGRRRILFTWDPDHDRELWIVSEYFPELRRIEQARFPSIDRLVDRLGAHRVVPFEIPFDFVDGYQPAFWRRPEAYLDPQVRAASSTFTQLPDAVVTPAIERLRADLASGAWTARHQDLLELDRVDYGYRLIVAG
jgi:SAM-dependent methyltransferase